MIFYRNSCLTMLWVICCLASGCMSDSDGNNAAHMWRELGEHTPSVSEVSELRRGLPESAQGLVKQLREGTVWERRRAAYILESLGTLDGQTATALTSLLETEKDRVALSLMVRALSQAPDARPVSAMRMLLKTRRNLVLRTYLCGAIVILSPSDSRLELQYLIDSLDPTARGEELTTDAARHEFWERRWAAVHMVEKLGKDAKAFVPALERLSDAADAPDWVNRQVMLLLQSMNR